MVVRGLPSAVKPQGENRFPGRGRPKGLKTTKGENMMHSLYTEQQGTDKSCTAPSAAESGKSLQGFRVGVDLGGTNIKVGLVDAENRILAEESCKTLAHRPWQEVAWDMVACIRTVMEKAGCPLQACQGVGIGSPGTVDSRTGVVVYSNNFSGWENIPLGAYISQELQVPVRISNDANCAALGEALAGAGRDCRDVVLITLGTGVGSGIILDGKIFEGGGPGGAELGHTVLVEGGEPCTCGRKGCWETYASATALIREAKRALCKQPESAMLSLCGGDPEKMNGEIPFVAAAQGDQAAAEVVERYIHYLGEGLVNVANIFRPQRILLSGGICGQGQRLTEPLARYLQAYVFAGKWTAAPEIRIATLGNKAGIVGAAGLFSPPEIM